MRIIRVQYKLEMRIKFVTTSKISIKLLICVIACITCFFDVLRVWHTVLFTINESFFNYIKQTPWWILIYRTLRKHRGLQGFPVKYLTLCMCISHSVVCNSLRPPRAGACQALLPWDSSCKDTGVGCHFFLQEIYLTQQTRSPVLQADCLPPGPPGKLRGLEAGSKA